MPTYLLTFALAAYVLSQSATYLVTILTRISRQLRLSQFSVGFIIMALATTLPELTVGITAALADEGTLSLGNVLGSNIANITLIIGLAAAIGRGAKVENRTTNQDIFYMNLSATAPIILIWDKVLSRTDGLILLIFYFFYLFRVLYQKKNYSKTMNHQSPRGLILNLARFLTGVGLLLASAKLLVISAGNIAAAIQMPLVLIGLFVVAIGTSLPELSFCATAMRKTQDSLAFGNIIGSVINNSTLILAVTSLIRPIQVTHMPLIIISSFFTIVSLIVFTFFLRSKNYLSVWESLGLLFLYGLFAASELYMESIL